MVCRVLSGQADWRAGMCHTGSISRDPTTRLVCCSYQQCVIRQALSASLIADSCDGTVDESWTGRPHSYKKDCLVTRVLSMFAPFFVCIAIVWSQPQSHSFDLTFFHTLLQYSTLPLFVKRRKETCTPTPAPAPLNITVDSRSATDTIRDGKERKLGK